MSPQCRHNDATMSPIGRGTKSVANCLLSIHKRLAATDLVAQRFYWSLRGLQVVLFLSQIGCRLMYRRSDGTCKLTVNANHEY